MKVIIVLILIGYVLCNEEDLREIDYVHPEASCSMRAGICVISNDCPDDALADAGLCPAQRSLGIECCLRASLKETRCEKLGGKCTSNPCVPRLRAYQSKNCPNKQYCCLLMG